MNVQKAFQINPTLPEIYKEKLMLRLKNAGFDLCTWPDTPLQKNASANDVAVLVVVGDIDTQVITERVKLCVNARVRIICVLLDEEPSISSIGGQLASAKVHIDSEKFERALMGDDTVQQTTSGRAAKKTDAPHNKC
jgi:hypothetical protein